MKPVYMIFCLCFAGCGAPEGIFLASLGGEKTQTFYEERKKSDSNREETLQRSKETYKSSKSCQDDPSCRAICARLFRYASDQKDCRELPPAQVDRFQDVYKAFQDKSRESLDKLTVFDLKVFLNLSAEPVLSLFKQSGFAAAKEILVWILADWERAFLFLEEDQDFIFLEALLKEIEISPISALGESIEGNMVFQELALRKQNDAAMDWVHGFFARGLCEEGEAQADCVLTQYCSVGGSFQKEALGAFMEFQGFRETLAEKCGGSFDERGLAGQSLIKDICPYLRSGKKDRPGYC